VTRLKPHDGMGQVYLDANAEAVRCGDRKVSTEHVLLALLAPKGSPVARALGVSPDDGRAALERLDRAALSSVGIHAEAAGPVLPGQVEDRLPMTPAVKAVFTGLRKQAGRDRIGVHHVLLGLLARTRPDPAAALIDALGIDRSAVRAQLEREQR